MPATHYLGRQPIVDADTRLVAYELLFRTSRANVAHVEDEVAATAAVLRHAFIDLGIGQVLGGRLGFINVEETMLLGDLLDALPADKVVLEILETVMPTPALLSRLAELRARGYRLALDDVAQLGAPQAALLPYADFIKVDLSQVDEAALPDLLAQLDGFAGTLLAEKVNTQQQFERCRELGFHWFQGYFFARPTVLSTQPASPSQAMMTHLLGLLLRDAGLDELEQAFKGSPVLAMMLMRLAEANGPASVASIREAIDGLGLRQIRNWVLLLVFAAPAPISSGRDALMELAAARGRVMELLAREYRPEHPACAERAFMVGMLSLADALWQQPKAEILAQLPLEDVVKEAVLEGGHPLSELLAVARALEDGQAPLPSGYDPEVLLRVQTQALDWVRRMRG